MHEVLQVGVDGTEPSRAALRWALRRAASVGSEVGLVHVLDDEWATISPRMFEVLRGDAKSLLETEADYARTHGPGIALETCLVLGSVIKELISASVGAEMVVVGTHKTGYIGGRIFGSTTLQLAASAHSPVALIPQTSRRDGRGIVVGIDDSESGMAAVRFGALEAQRTGEHLTLLRAFTLPNHLAAHDPVRDEAIRQIETIENSMLADAARIAASMAPKVEVRTRTVQRAPAEALADASAAAALLVIGNSRGTGASAGVVGSVAHDVLMNLSGPIVVMHPGD